MRNLKVSDSINLNGCKEFNHLRITDLQEFLSNYTNNLDYYKPPFKILAELEEKILFENNPEEFISIDYKDWGEILFGLNRIYEHDDLRIVEYSYIGSGS